MRKIALLLALAAFSLLSPFAVGAGEPQLGFVVPLPQTSPPACNLPWVGGHCITTDGLLTAPTFNIAFDKPGNASPAVKVPKEINGSAETYVVPQGTTMSVANINTFVYLCVDGATAAFNQPMRARLVSQQPATVVGSNQAISEAPACYGGGGTVYSESPSFSVFTFSASNIYTFDIEYSQSISSNDPCWALAKRVNVLVGPGKIKVEPVGQSLVGIQNSIYGKDEEVGREVLWKITNIGGIDVKLLNIVDAKCGNNGASGFLENCSFTNFRQENKGMLLETGKFFLLKERFSAKPPKASPAKDSLAINVVFSDAYDMIISSATSTQVAVEQDVEFKVQGSAITPYTKNGQFSVKNGAKYWVQTCFDSQPSDPSRMNLDVYGVTVFKDAARTQPVAATNFHRVDYCSGTSPEAISSLLLNNQGDGPAQPGAPPEEQQLHGSGLKSFVADADGTYYYTIEGIVGTALGYKSDFARIGTLFDDENQIVEDLVVDDKLGQQSFVSAETSANSLKLNAIEGPIVAGPFTPQPSMPGGGATGISKAVYKLKDIIFNKAKPGSVSVPGPVTRASDNESFIEISPNGIVTARTSAIGNANAPLPQRDVNAAWADKEKFMFEVKAKDAGVCRTMQGEALTDFGNPAFSGPNANPRVKYDWRPSAIAENFCDSGNQDYKVCDATQFSFELIKKLESISQLYFEGKASEASAKQVFRPYLMKDGFTRDFLNDFALHMENSSFDQLMALRDKGWPNYFKSETRLKFALLDRVSEQGDSKYALAEPGLYEAEIDLKFDSGKTAIFDSAKNPSATITVRLKRIAPVPQNQNSLLYRLPIDGIVGTSVSGSGSVQGYVLRMHREGYGVGFTGDNAMILNAKDKSIFTYSLSEDSKPIATIEVNKISDFAQLNKDAPRILKIQKKPGSQDAYLLSFSPSTPKPMMIMAQGLTGKGISAAYHLFEQAPQEPGVVSDRMLARLTQIGFEKTPGAMQCTDPTLPGDLGLPIRAINGNATVTSGTGAPVTGWDKQLSAFSDVGCDIIPALANSKDSTYFFTRNNSSDGRILLETMIYQPAQKGFTLKNACTSQGAIYAKDGTSSKNAEKGGGQITMPASDSMASVSEVLDLIVPEDACITYGTTREGSATVPNSVSIWWNEEKLSKQFREQMNPALKSNQCF